MLVVLFVAATALTKNHAEEQRITVGPVAVLAQGWAERISPATEEVTLTTSAHQNRLDAERARLRAVAAGTINIAVTRKTPTAQTEKITTTESKAAKTYW